MARYIRRDLVLAIAFIVVAMGLWLILEIDWKMPFGLLFLAVALLLVVLAIGFRYTRLSVTKFRALKDPTSVWRFSPDFIAVKTELGSSEFRWEVITEVWCYPDLWLLLFGQAGYSVLPVAPLSKELQAFIVVQVQGHGGKVA